MLEHQKLAVTYLLRIDDRTMMLATADERLSFAVSRF